MPEPCDVDDILCQLETLRHLRGLQHEMGKEAFAHRFPEFIGLDARLSDEILSQEGSLDEALKRCQLSRPEETEEWQPEWPELEEV